MATKKVCVLLAGRGSRMGHYSDWIHKSLLPLEGRAILTHILENFDPSCQFVFAVNHLADQIRDYVQLVHPDLDVRYQYVDNIDQPGAGPGYSLLRCRQELNEPFFLVCGDTLWKWPATGTDESRNWMGTPLNLVKPDARFCNLRVESSGRIGEIRDKDSSIVGSDATFRPFVGLAHIRDHLPFFSSLENETGLIGRERQLSNGFQGLLSVGCFESRVDWQDTGTLDDYLELRGLTQDGPVDKAGEEIYFHNGQVIKYFADSKITSRRAERSNREPKFFPKIERVVGGFSSRNFIPGRPLAEFTDSATWEKFFAFLEGEFWAPRQVSELEKRIFSREFYINKSLARIRMFFDRNPGLRGRLISVNGDVCESPEAWLGRMEPELLGRVIPSRIHGDLQPENVIVTPGSDFALIDWRQDFGGNLDVGDLHWDFAKMAMWFQLPLGQLRHSAFSAQIRGTELNYTLGMKTHVGLKAEFDSLIRRRGLDYDHIQMLAGLAFLNMAGLHSEPFDLLFFAMGMSALFRVKSNHSPAAEAHSA